MISLGKEKCGLLKVEKGEFTSFNDGLRVSLTMLYLHDIIYPNLIEGGYYV